MVHIQEGCGPYSACQLNELTPGSSSCISFSSWTTTDGTLFISRKEQQRIFSYPHHQQHQHHYFPFCMSFWGPGSANGGKYVIVLYFWKLLLCKDHLCAILLAVFCRFSNGLDASFGSAMAAHWRSNPRCNAYEEHHIWNKHQWGYRKLQRFSNYLLLTCDPSSGLAMA